MAPSKNDVDIHLDSNNIKKEAGDNTERETTMPFFEALRKYRKAVMWSCLLLAALIMEGFDHSHISGFYGFIEAIWRVAT
jgi:SP family general alpha glucoside:H+ symporter-like MFS transporter